ncbi:hypothetical protein P170DRAFT_122903 [Aspergillus steynii IBT 23096]|uniref:Uncharacterized protein n=1 Tax=Aspergillus steynii IBT 23096 TaxID=1392250 RepID=A0A2I2GJM3_9EURO|nr:uncharacterized protein P170DRAFT_122903 [Aspergillus steynii IBT 23096]PLB53070.1 hypothetical protein P170DRAFT_122903 [Aspergillus steynii IBT 23096]
MSSFLFSCLYLYGPPFFLLFLDWIWRWNWDWMELAVNRAKGRGIIYFYADRRQAWNLQCLSRILFLSKAPTGVMTGEIGIVFLGVCVNDWKYITLRLVLLP